MPKLPSSNPKQFVQGAPVLHVSDVVATAEFYRDVLGFMWDFGDQSYAVVWRDNSAIHFVRDDASPRGVHLNPRDRKSTRLNSSHSQISYAVFCLKKKIITYVFTLTL